MSEFAQMVASIATLIAAVGALIATLKGNRKVDAVALNVNGGLSKLLELLAQSQRSDGHAAGVEAERVREKDTT